MKSVGDAFDEMTAGAFAGQQRLFRRLHGDDARVRPAVFDGFAATGQRAARAESGHEGMNRPAHLPQNLLPGAVLVIRHVQRVLKLAGRK